MRRFVILGLFALGCYGLLVVQPGRITGQANAYRAAGSAVGLQTGPRESGSTIRRPRSFREAGSSLPSGLSERSDRSATLPSRIRVRQRETESGSAIRYPVRESESGSTLRYQIPQRESGSMLRGFHSPQEAGSGLRRELRQADPYQSESGSALVPIPGRKTPGDNNDPPRGNGIRKSGETREYRESYREPSVYREYAAPRATPEEARMQDATLILIAVLIFLFGGFVGFFLFRGGPALSPAGELWSKQVELSCEILQQMDAILLDVQTQDWDRCRDSVEALRELNGRRMLLLNNDINRAIIVFLAAANYCLGQKDGTAHFSDMKTSYHAAIDAMRKIANSEAVSEEIHRLLDASHQQMRAIRRKESGAA